MQVETTFEDNKKVIWTDLKGFFDAEKTQEGVDIFEESLKTFPVEEYTLVIDSTELATMKPEILPILAYSYVMYNRFKMCIMINPTKPITRSQLQRIARNLEDKQGNKVEFKGIFVDTKEEALKLIG